MGTRWFTLSWSIRKVWRRRKDILVEPRNAQINYFIKIKHPVEAIDRGLEKNCDLFCMNDHEYDSGTMN